MPQHFSTSGKRIASLGFAWTSILVLQLFVNCSEPIPQSLNTNGASGGTGTTGTTGDTDGIPIDPGGGGGGVTITIQPSPRTLQVGQNLNSGEFCIVAIGSNLTYQWYKDSSIASGKTAACLIITNVQISNSGSYKVKVTANGDASKAVTSNAAQLTVQAAPPPFQAPVITTDLTNKTLQVGNNLTGFCVGATGTNLKYQWYKNSATISGATASCYNKNNIQLADAGQYFVRLTASDGTQSATKDSARVTLTVNSPPPPADTVDPAVITSNLQNKTVTAGDNLSGFCVTATGVNLTYQWYKNSAVLSGATNSCYTKTNVQSADAGQYFVRLTTRNGTAVATKDSATATLTVNPLPEKLKVVGMQTYSKCSPSCGTQQNEGDYIVQATLNTKTNSITAYLTHICRYPYKCNNKEIVVSAAKTFSATEANFFYFTDIYGSVAYMAFYDSDTKCIELSELGTTKVTKCFDAATGYLVGTEIPPTIVKGIGGLDGKPIVWETYYNATPSPQGGALCIVANGTNLKYQWYLDGVAESGQTAQCFKKTLSFKNGTTTNWYGTIKVKVSNSAGSVESSATANLYVDQCAFGGCGY